MLDEETSQQMFDRLMILVNDIRALGSNDWNDYKVTKKMLRAFSPRNMTFATMIRREKSFKKMTPTQLLSELLHHDLYEKHIATSLGKKVKSGACEEVEAKIKTPKAKKKEESSEEESTDEELALLMRNFKSFMKKRYFKKNFGDKDKRRPKKRLCYECGENGHFIAECPNKKNKDKEENKRNKYGREEKRRDYKKKYQKQGHFVMERNSNDEDSEDEGVATLAIQKPSSSTRLFNNLSDDDEDHASLCLMARGTKVKSKPNTSFSLSSPSE